MLACFLICLVVVPEVNVKLGPASFLLTCTSQPLPVQTKTRNILVECVRHTGQDESCEEQEKHTHRWAQGRNTIVRGCSKHTTQSCQRKQTTNNEQQTTSFFNYLPTNFYTCLTCFDKLCFSVSYFYFSFYHRRRRTFNK